MTPSLGPRRRRRAGGRSVRHFPVMPPARRDLQTCAGVERDGKGPATTRTMSGSPCALVDATCVFHTIDEQCGGRSCLFGADLAAHLRRRDLDLASQTDANANAGRRSRARLATSAQPSGGGLVRPWCPFPSCVQDHKELRVWCSFRTDGGSKMGGVRWALQP